MIPSRLLSTSTLVDSILTLTCFSLRIYAGYPRVASPPERLRFARPLPASISYSQL